MKTMDDVREGLEDRIKELEEELLENTKNLELVERHLANAKDLIDDAERSLKDAFKEIEDAEYELS